MDLNVRRDLNGAAGQPGDFGAQRHGAAEKGARSATPSDAELKTMPAPQHVPTVLWKHSSVAERRALLDGQLPPALRQSALAASVAVPMPGSGSIALPNLPSVGRVAVELGRLGVLALPLALSGDTPRGPQPAKHQIAPDLALYVSPDGKQAWFARETERESIGPLRFLPHSERLDVPVQLVNGQAVFDPSRLQDAYGKPLPPHVMPAARPVGVSNTDLQTTSSRTATAMASSPDPCKNAPGQSHHVIPADLMKGNEAFFTKIGFKLDGGKNMLRLPNSAASQADMNAICGETRSIHSGRHDGYSKAVDEQIKMIKRDLSSGKLNSAEAKAKVDLLMNELQIALRSGRYQSMNDPALIRHINNLRI